MERYHHFLALDLAGGRGDRRGVAIGIPTAHFIATRAVDVRLIWVFLITIPYWMHLLVRTVPMTFLLRDQGPLNGFLL